MGHTGTGPHNTSNSSMPQIISHAILEDVIRVFHKYCDPYDMFPEDVPVWEAWDRRFNPEKYDDIQNEERDSST